MFQHDSDNLGRGVKVNTANRQAANRNSINHQLLCSIFLAALIIAGAVLPARGQDQASPLSPTQGIGSYEGQPVSAVEVVGQPDVATSQLEPLIRQKAGQPFSQQQVEASISALKKEGKFQDVQLQVLPEASGVRVRFVLQPALYFGVYEFPGAIRSFSYSRLLQISNYQSQEPYSAFDLQQAEDEPDEILPASGFFRSRRSRAITARPGKRPGQRGFPDGSEKAREDWQNHDRRSLAGRNRETPEEFADRDGAAARRLSQERHHLHLQETANGHQLSATGALQKTVI